MHQVVVFGVKKSNLITARVDMSIFVKIFTFLKVPKPQKSFFGALKVLTPLMGVRVGGNANFGLDDGNIHKVKLSAQF